MEKPVSHITFNVLHFYLSEEVPEDWGPWAEWTKESAGVLVRKRKCLNKTGKCTGNDTEKITTTVTEEYTVEVDKGEI